MKVNPGRLAVPPCALMRTKPLLPGPTTAVMVLLLTKEKDDAAVPPKLTEVKPVKLLPLMVTVVPLGAISGLKEVITGTGIAAILKPARLAVPPGVVTLTLPLEPKLTVAVMVLLFTTV